MTRGSNIHYSDNKDIESYNLDPLAPSVISTFLKKKNKGKETPRNAIPNINTDQSVSSQTKNNQVINDYTRELEVSEDLRNFYEVLINQESKERDFIKGQEFFGRDKTNEEKELEKEILDLMDQFQLDINLKVKIDQERFDEAHKKLEKIHEIEIETNGRMKLMEKWIQQEDHFRKLIDFKEKEEFDNINQDKLTDLEQINSNKFDLKKSVETLENYLRKNYGLNIVKHNENNILDDIKKYVVGITKGITYGYYLPSQKEIHYQEFSRKLSSKEVSEIKISIIDEANIARKDKEKKLIKYDNQVVSDKLNYLINTINQDHPHRINKTMFHEAFHAVTYLCSDKKDILGNIKPCSSSYLLMSDDTKKIIYDLCEMQSPTYLNILDDQFQSEIVTHLLERLVDVTNGKLKTSLKKGDYLNFAGLKTDDLASSIKALEIIQDSFSSTRKVCINKLPEILNPIFSMQFLIINDAKEKIKELQEIKKIQDKTESTINPVKQDIKGEVTTSNLQSQTKIVESWLQKIEKMRSENRENNGRE